MINRVINFLFALIFQFVVSATADAQKIRDLLPKEPIGPLAAKQNTFTHTSFDVSPNRIEAEPFSWSSTILPELRMGGVVIFIRQPATVNTVENKSINNWWLQCGSTRSLTPQSIKLMGSIGNAIKRMRVPVSEVRTSEFCSALDAGSAIGIGFAKSSAALNSVDVLSSQGLTASQIADGLKTQFLSTPAIDTSTIFIGHDYPSSFLADPILAGLGEGEAALFRRHQDNTIEFLTRVKPGQWETIALEDEAERVRDAALFEKRQLQNQPSKVAIPNVGVTEASANASSISQLHIDARIKLASSALINALKKGGYILYMHHMQATLGIDANLDVIKNWQQHCVLQANLTERGKKDAVNVGGAIRALQIPIGNIYTSDFCRAKDTATLMGFKKFSVKNILDFSAGQTMLADRAFLRAQLLASHPVKGTNTLLVSHPHIDGIMPLELTIRDSIPGEIIVFAPNINGRAQPIGSITVAQWNQLASN